MRRLYLFLSFVMATAWLLWAACETDDYRSVLPLRPLDGGPVAVPTDMPVDLATPADLSKPDLAPSQDLPPAADLLPRPDQGGVTDGGTITDGGQLPDGAVAG